MRKTIGIIGQGFVGTAVRNGFEQVCDVIVFDKKEPRNTRLFVEGICQAVVHTDDPLMHLVRSCPLIFLCLPTPMLSDGRCFLGIVEEVLQQVCSRCGEISKRVTIAIKSTVPPGTTDALDSIVVQDGQKWIDVCFQPEFLTEAHATEDFKNQQTVMCGGTNDAVSVVREVYAEAFPHAKFFAMTAVEAELVKYFTNCGLACRVSLANEFAQICNTLKVEYNKVIGIAKENALGKTDTRMGLTHWDVPGPDGSRGFGGSCFPKDLNALIHVARELGVEPTMMEAAWKKNLEVRPKKDWERLEGRAVLKG